MHTVTLNTPPGTRELRHGSGLDSRVTAYPPPVLDSRAVRVPTRWSGGLALRSRPLRLQPTTTLALIGGQRLLREATASLLTAQRGLDVLGTFESADHFLAVDWKSPPAVLLLDCDGADLAECHGAVQALAFTRESRIVMLCHETCEEVVRCAIEHGVSGVLLKSYSAEDVRAAIAYTATGRTVMPAGWQLVVDRHPGGRPGLSPRHRQILALIATGRSNDEIALDLDVSPNTIKFHVRALYARMGVHNRVEAANQYAHMANGGA
jgi:DNA-binding NarL/FixJ family response regulator